jgi:hypothetical protein
MVRISNKKINEATATILRKLGHPRAEAYVKETRGSIHTEWAEYGNGSGTHQRYFKGIWIDSYSHRRFLNLLFTLGPRHVLEVMDKHETPEELRQLATLAHDTSSLESLIGKSRTTIDTSFRRYQDYARTQVYNHPLV